MSDSYGKTRRTVRVHSMDDVPTKRAGAERVVAGQLESMFLARVDGRRTIGDIGGLIGLSPAESSVMVGQLVELGLVEITEGEPPTRRPE